MSPTTDSFLKFFVCHILVLGSALGSLESVHAQGTQAAAATLRLDGISIDFDASGEWVAMYSTYTQPVNLPDQRGIRDAYTIAEERGKAALVRYFEESVTTGRLVEEVSRESQNARRAQGSQGDSFTRESERNMSLSISEFSRSFSRGTLRGVTVLERGYDAEVEEVWVTVGFSRLTAGVAAQIQRDVANPPATRPVISAPSAGGAVERPRSSTSSRPLPTAGAAALGSVAVPVILSPSVARVVDVERRSRSGGVEEFTGFVLNGELQAGLEVEVTLIAYGSDQQEVGRTIVDVTVGRVGASQMFRATLAPTAAIASVAWTVAAAPGIPPGA